MDDAATLSLAYGDLKDKHFTLRHTTELTMVFDAEKRQSGLYLVAP